MINSEIDKYSYLQFSEVTETHIVIPPNISLKKVLTCFFFIQ